MDIETHRPNIFLRRQWVRLLRKEEDRAILAEDAEKKPYSEKGASLGLNAQGKGT